MPTISDPVRGFTDTVLGGLAVTFAIAVGFARVYQTEKDFSYDAISSDFVVNSTLVIAKELATTKETPRTFNQVSHTGRTAGGEKRKIMQALCDIVRPQIKVFNFV
jgi:hypothetical protein